MEENFVTFLQNKFKTKNTTSKEEINTNVTYYHPESTTISYFIPPNYYDIFLEKISKEIFGTPSRGFEARYNEQGQAIKKFIMDFDFITTKEVFEAVAGGHDRVFNESNVKYIVSTIDSLLRSFYTESVVDGLEIYIMKRNKGVTVEQDGRMKDGLHLSIPDLRCDSNFLLYFRKKFIHRLFKITDSPFYPARDNAEEIVDKHVLLRTAWMIYGCSKTGDKPYLVNYSYKLNDLNNPIVEGHDHKGCVKKFSMLYLDNATSYDVKFDSSEIPVEFQQQKAGLKILPGTGKQYTTEEVSNIWKILDNLSSKYYTDYMEWKNVGLILSSMSRQSDQIYPLWIKFSQKSMKQFNQSSSDSLWSNAVEGFWNESHLMNRLKQSNMKVYEEILNGDLKKKIYYHFGPWLEHDVAEILWYYAKDRFKMCSVKHNDKQVYEFSDHIWKYRKNSVSLHMCLKREVYGLFHSVLTKVSEEINKSTGDVSDDSVESEEKIKGIKLKRKNIETLLSNLRRERFKKDVVDAAFDFFNDYEFMDNMNKKPNLFAFKNGVLNTWTGEFLPGNPDDNITQQCPFNYYPYTEEVKEVFDQIDKFYASIFPNPELARFMKHIDAECLQKTTNDARTFFCYGSGSNGKTKRTTLFQSGFGNDYYCELDVGVLTQTRKKNGEANSEKAKLKDKNVCYTSEIGKNEKLNMATVKELTGGGQVTGGREIYKSASEGQFKASSRIFWQINYKPKIDCDIDDGVERRLRVIIFEVMFVRDDDPRILKNPEKYKARDEAIDIKIEIWAKYYCSYLAHILITEIIGKPRIVEPKCVVDATAEYLASINMLEKFKRDSFEETEPFTVLTVDQIWFQFIKWQKESNFNEKLSKEEVVEYMRNRFEKYINGKEFAGLKIRDF